MPAETCALSIKQPWASLIIHGFKDVENRSWSTTYRGPLLIHAGLREDQEGWHTLFNRHLRLPEDPPLGGIIGCVTLHDCVRNYPSSWAIPDQWHWILRDAHPLPFQRCKGKLGLFRPALPQPLGI
jgi:ASCH domain-containing protein